MSAEVAAQHPTETWQILVAVAAGIIALVGVIYNRLNKDVDEIEQRQDNFEKTHEAQINGFTRELESASTNIVTITKQIEEIFRRLTIGAESFSSLREDMREVETRIDAIMREIEQKAGSNHDSIRDLKEEYKRLKDTVDQIDRRCFKQHPGMQ